MAKLVYGVALLALVFLARTTDKIHDSQTADENTDMLLQGKLQMMTLPKKDRSETLDIVSSQDTRACTRTSEKSPNYVNGQFTRDLRSDIDASGFDLVITWVNCSDSKWARASGESADNWHGIDDVSQFDLRGCSRDIRYVLRSFTVHAGRLLNNVYIVHSDLHGPPAFLRAETTKRPRLHFVRHSDILPANILPTFNRDIIMSGLHRIPCLAEWFIHAEDDNFVMRPLDLNLLVEGQQIGESAWHEPRLWNSVLLQDVVGSGGSLYQQYEKGPPPPVYQTWSFWQGVSSLWTSPPTGRFEELHTNSRDMCPDVYWKDTDLVAADYPCFRHGILPAAILNDVQTKLEGFQHGPMWVNAQGPGMDDCYGGQFYNKINPITAVYKAWLQQNWPQALHFETEPSDPADLTPHDVLERLRKGPQQLRNQ